MPPVAEPRLCLWCSPHEDSALCVAFSSADPNSLASGGEDGALLLHDIRCCESSASASSSTSSGKTAFEDPVAALSWQSERVLYVGSGKKVHLVDVRKIESPPFPLAFEAEDDVSSLSVARDAKTLAVADDSGSVTLVDLTKAGRSSFSARKLPSAHGGSVATAACFRPNRSGESLVSGGCDCTVARWDCFSKRLVRRWQAGELVTAQQTEEEVAERQPTRMFNPPFVHSLAAPAPLSSFAASSRKPWNALVAAAVGDGSVVVLDCDASLPSSASSGASSRKKKQQQRKEDPSRPFEGVLAVLGRDEGGHATAATCVSFVDGGGEGDASAPPPTLLASGGDDGRVLFWRWAEKAAAFSSELPPSWSSALAPFARGGGDGDEFPLLAAATPRGAKLQALDSRRGLVAAADTSEVVKLYRLE